MTFGENFTSKLKEIHIELVQNLVLLGKDFHGKLHFSSCALNYRMVTGLMMVGTWKVIGSSVFDNQKNQSRVNMNFKNIEEM